MPSTKMVAPSDAPTIATTVAESRQFRRRAFHRSARNRARAAPPARRREGRRGERHEAIEADQRFGPNFEDSFRNREVVGEIEVLDLPAIARASQGSSGCPS